MGAGETLARLQLRPLVAVLVLEKPLQNFLLGGQGVGDVGDGLIPDRQFLLAAGKPIGKSLAELALPHNLLAVMIARDGRNLVPDGQTVLADGDLLVFAARAFEDRENLSLREVPIDKGHKWNGRSLREISTPQQTLVILIQRGAHTMIPDGGTRIQTGDVLVLAQPGKP